MQVIDLICEIEKILCNQKIFFVAYFSSSDAENKNVKILSSIKKLIYNLHRNFFASSSHELSVLSCRLISLMIV